MAEKDFWDIYRSSQEKITMTDDLKQSILRNAQHCGNGREAAPALDAGPAGPVRIEAPRRPPRARPEPHRRVVRFALPIAACLTLVALAAGLVFLGTDNSSGSNNPGIPSLAIKAYAAETDTILARGEGGQIIFSRALVPHDTYNKDRYLAEGYYTGSLFRVEGEGIVRVQASVSTGVLYRQSIETIVRGDNAERWDELVQWKPSMRGLGEYAAEYDNIQTLPPRGDGLPKDSPERQVRVALSKKLGSTMDVSLSDGSPEYSFGFWTNDDYGDFPEAGGPDAIIDLFDGAMLTVTATFADGQTATHRIELYSGD
ncbi:MAG: hypothetical protein LBB46_06310, partial [Coriobacteriaceae bacterium]|nr:hypothetical protein [Coriobacteriaceae bacterium]